MAGTATVIIGQGWDEPRYRARTDRFEVSFLPSAGEPLDAGELTGVLQRLDDR